MMSQERLAEIRYFIIYCILFIAGFLIVFNKQSAIYNLLFSIQFIFLFLLPGYFIGTCLNLKSNVERTLIGIITSIAITGILSYLFGIMRFHVKYHSWIIPLLIIIGAIWINNISKKIRKSKKNKNCIIRWLSK